MMKRGRWTGLIALMALLSWCAGASAAETIGSKLKGGLSYSGYCSTGPFGLVHDGLAASRQMPGGLTADQYGVITRWRIETGDFAPEYHLPIQLRTYTRNGADSYTGGSQSAVVQLDPPAGLDTVEMPTRIPIQAGQTIGIDIPNESGLNKCLATDTDASCAGASDLLGPPLPPGMMGSATQANSCVYLNADREPDVDRDGYGDESQDSCPSIAKTHTLTCREFKRQRCLRKPTRLRRRLCLCRLKPTRVKRRRCAARVRAQARRD